MTPPAYNWRGSAEKFFSRLTQFGREVFSNDYTGAAFSVTNATQWLTYPSKEAAKLNNNNNENYERTNYPTPKDPNPISSVDVLASQEISNV